MKRQNRIYCAIALQAVEIKGNYVMKLWISALVVVFSAGLIGCADTPEGETKIVEATSSMARNPDEVTCRSVVRTGTRIGSKKCMTNARWLQASRDGREAAEDVQRKSTMTPTVGGN